MYYIVCKMRYALTVSIDQLWDGCSGVSNAGKKRGRGKRGATKKRIKLSMGKSFGYGKFYWSL